MNTFRLSSSAPFRLSVSDRSDSRSDRDRDGSRSEPWNEEDIRRALRHHGRALRALRGTAYETLPEATRNQLVQRLEEDRRELLHRLQVIQRHKPAETPTS